MTRKQVVVGGVVAALAAAGVVLATRCGDDETSAAGGRTAGADDGASATASLRAKRIDVATVKRGSIAGVVRDPKKAPVAGAEVCGVGSSDEIAPEALREPSCVKAGPDGAYRLDGLLPASYELVAQAPGFVPAHLPADRDDDELKLAIGEAKTGVDLELGEGGVEVHGIVRDIGGGPVPEAWVTARDGWWRRGGGVVRSDAEGKFSLWAKPGALRVRADADGYASNAQEGVAPGLTFEILLTPESVLAGRVVEAGTGTPVADATVSVSGAGDFMSGDVGEGGSALTDADGRFRVERLTQARYKASAEAPGRYGQSPRSVLLGLGQTVDDVVIEVHPARAVRGKVVLADGKTPCAKGRVDLSDAGNDSVGETVEAGRVEIDPVQPGTYKVDVSCEGYVAPTKIEPIVVPEKGDIPEQVWTVSAAGKIVGRVLDGDGKPAAEVSVRGRPVAATKAWGEGDSDFSDKDGTFELEGLKPGSYKVSLGGWRTSDEDAVVVEVVAGGEASVELRVPSKGSISGVVVDDAGTPLAGADISARGKSWQDSGEATTRDDGGFEVKELAPGSYRVTATARGGGWTGMRAPGQKDDDDLGVKVEVRAGQAATVRLVVERQNGVIKGRVVDGSGAPVNDAFLDSQRESESAAAAAGASRVSVRWGWGRTPILTDTDGNFAIKDLGPGRYTVRAYRRGGGESVAEHVALGSAITLTIRPTGSLAGRVTAPSGPAPRRMTVQARDTTTGVSRVEEFFRTDGRFEIRDLPAGTYAVDANAVEGSGKIEGVALADGQAVEGLAIALAARAKVTGRLVSKADGKPIVGYMMSAAPAGGGMSGFRFSRGPDTPMTGADGRFAIEDAPAGKVMVTAFPTDFGSSMTGPVRKVFTLEAGRTTDLGDILVRTMRLKMGEPEGDLGFQLKQPTPGTEMEAYVLEVAIVRPGGPAAASGLVVGDVIVALDGEDFSTDPMGYWMQSRVPQGTKITLGLKRGADVEIVAGPPRR